MRARREASLLGTMERHGNQQLLYSGDVKPQVLLRVNGAICHHVAHVQCLVLQTGEDTRAITPAHILCKPGDVCLQHMKANLQHTPTMAFLFP